jgi:serine/threonine protein kinase
VLRPESGVSQRFIEKIAAAKAEVHAQAQKQAQTLAPSPAEPSFAGSSSRSSGVRKVPSWANSGVAGSVGERFGRYLLFESLGSGGMAQVFRAVLPMMDEQYGKTVAIKRILPCYTEDRSFVELLLDEARLTLRLNHPNVAQTYEVGRHGEHYFMAMEYVDGPSLAELLRAFERQKLRFPIDIAIAIAMQVASGLYAAHELCDEHGQRLGVVHRDVSPQNLLIDRQGIVKLIDFGVAKAHDRIVRTMDGAIRGKLSFFSPERAAGEDFDHRADLFSLGLLLWMMLTGSHPLKDLGQVESLLAMHDWKAPRLRDEREEAPEELEQVLLRLLATDAETRHSSGEQVRADLAAVLYSQQPTFSPLRLAELVAAYDDAELAALSRSVGERSPVGRPRAVVAGSLAAAEDDFWGSAFERDKAERLPLLEEAEGDERATVPLVESLADRPTQMMIPAMDSETLETLLKQESSQPMAIAKPTVEAPRRPQSSRASLFLMLGMMAISAVLGALVMQLRAPAVDEGVQGSGAAPQQLETQAVQLAELELKTKPARAEIAINGEATGSVTPAVLALPPGQVEIELWREGYEPRLVSLELGPGARKVVHLDLLAAKASVELSVDTEMTVMVELPQLQRRYLLTGGEGVVIDGLRQGEELELVLRKADGGVVHRRLTPRSDFERVRLQLSTP